MELTDNDLRVLIGRAGCGDVIALGRLLEHFRPRLRAMAQEVVRRGLQVRLSESDIVQQTFSSAIRNRSSFRGEAPQEFEAWLRIVHERNLQNAIRDHIGYEKRDLRREHPDSTAAASATAGGWSPSEIAMSRERQEQVLAAIERLPVEQRLAVKLRHLEGKSLADIAAQLDRSVTAAAGLLKRGVSALKDHLEALREEDA